MLLLKADQADQACTVVLKREKRLFDIENIGIGNKSIDIGSNHTTKIQIISISFPKMTCEL